MKPLDPTQMKTAAEVASAERTLTVGSWVITVGAVVYSVLTVTPFMADHTAPDYRWTAPVLPIVVDSAVVIVVRLDAALARLHAFAPSAEGKTRRSAWPFILRWLTGLLTLALNVGASALAGDWVGVGVHMPAPLLLIVNAEAALAYRRAITVALARIEAEEREHEDRERAEAEAREQREREEREREADRRERSEREAREHAERMAREQADRDREERREALEAEQRLERERLASEERREQAAREERREERERQERREREECERADEERERQQREARERRTRPAREREPQRTAPAPAPREQRAPKPVNTTEQRPVNSPSKLAKSKLPELVARDMVREMNGTLTVRQLADRTGWSVGWVSGCIADLRTTDEDQAQTPAEGELVGAVAGGGEQ
ncbi:hypothetical protein [Streptomyces rhizosphaericus]|uniref:hypothetical protein n=1 Tax=Streptomyces rhizosphaericus TaxID=114699 RepID=UPI0019CFBACB|nr:hypothetical protein [Streptomyces rhizosphaericus]